MSDLIRREDVLSLLGSIYTEIEDHFPSAEPERKWIPVTEALPDKQIYSYDIAKKNLELSERNDPLSWDELRRIDEEPIWIEVKNGEKKWVITCIDPDDVDRIYITDAYGLRGILNMKMYFKGEIKAYRKERK